MAGIFDDKSSKEASLSSAQISVAETGAATPPEKDVERVAVDRYEFNEQTNFVSKRVVITIFLACAGVDFLSLMDQTTLAGSLSTIGSSLHASNQASWIAGGYFLTSTAFQLLYGRLSDIWSRKVVLLTGIAIFFVGSLASSLSQSIIQLIIFRALTGIGGGGLETVAQMIVSDVVPLRERGKYQGILGSAVAIANGIGPVVGGAIASRSAESWRWIFRMNLPLALLTTTGVVFFMPLRKVEGHWKLKLKAVDFFGAFLALSGAAVFMLGLTWGGGEKPWNSPSVIATLTVGFSVSVLFVVWEWKGSKSPLVPMHVFKVPLVNGACLTHFINGWNFLVQVYYLPVFYQLVYGYSATKAGALILPITLTQTVCSTLSGLFIRKVGRYRECLLLGWAVWAAGLGLISTLGESSGLGKQIGYGILTGFGVGNTLQPNIIALQAGASQRDMAVVTAFRSFIRNLGGTLGLAIVGAIINNVILSSLAPLGLSQEALHLLLSNPHTSVSEISGARSGDVHLELVHAYKKGFRIVFIVSASLSALAFLIALWLMPQVSLDKDDKQAEEVKEDQASDAEGSNSKSPVVE